MSKTKANAPLPAQSTGEELGEILDLSVRSVEALARKGTVERVRRGRYDTRAAVRGYIRALREQAAGRASGETENAKHKRALRRLAEMRLQRETGQLIAVADARDVWASIIVTVRQAVLSLPGRIAFDCPALTVHDRQKIEQIAHDMLMDVSMGRGFAIVGGEDETASEVSDKEETIA